MTLSTVGLLVQSGWQRYLPVSRTGLLCLGFLGAAVHQGSTVGRTVQIDPDSNCTPVPFVLWTRTDGLHLCFVGKVRLRIRNESVDRWVFLCLSHSTSRVQRPIMSVIFQPTAWEEHGYTVLSVLVLGTLQLISSLLRFCHEFLYLFSNCVAVLPCRCCELFSWFHVHSDSECEINTDTVLLCWFLRTVQVISRSIRFFHHHFLTSCLFDQCWTLALYRYCASHSAYHRYWARNMA